MTGYLKNMGTGSSRSSPREESRKQNFEDNTVASGTTTEHPAEKTNGELVENDNNNVLETKHTYDIHEASKERSVADSKETQTKSKMERDQSYEIPELIIAIRDGNFTRQKTSEFEISGISANDMMRQVEEKKSTEELENLAEAKRHHEEELAREEKLYFLHKRLNVMYTEIEDYSDDSMNINQGVIDNLSNLLRHFHGRNLLEPPLPILEKRAIVLENKLRKRKRQKGQFQRKHIEATPAIIKQTNPDIAELCSPSRAHKLAAQMTALYDSDRKHTFAEARQRSAQNVSDIDLVCCLRDMFLFSFTRCQDVADRQTNTLLRSLTLADQEPLSTQGADEETTPTHEETINELSCRLLIKEFQYNITTWSLGRLKKMAIKEIFVDETFDVVTKTLHVPPFRSTLNQFLDKCIDVGWFSQIVSPALTVVYDRNPSSRSMFKAYTSEGSNISHVVWPALLQPMEGVLVKGVAIFDDKRDSNKNSARIRRIFQS